jgi:Xaa-Pro aminopeptidase
MRPTTSALQAAAASRRDAVAASWNTLGRPVLVAAGEPISIPGGADQVYPFKAHPQYRWLSEQARPGSVMAFDPERGWTHFVPPVTDLERTWEGDTEIQGETRPPDELDSWLGGRSPVRLAVGATPDVEPWERPLDDLRRHLDETELARVRLAVDATVAAHRAAADQARPGQTERTIQIELERAGRLAGADSMGYGSIVAADSNAAVFHFTPGDRSVQEAVLIDAGAEVDGYVADVTRVFSAGGPFSSRRQAVYEIVHEAERQAIAACTVGTEWHDVHRTAARVIAQGLIDLGLGKGAVDAWLESGAVGLFFPHGIGHMLGAGVRGVPGVAPGRPWGRECCGARPRIDLPLEAGHLVTVEPGLYFVRPLLEHGSPTSSFGTHWSHGSRSEACGSKTTWS